MHGFTHVSSIKFKAMPKRKRRRMTIVPPRERFVVALFRVNKTTKRVTYMGLATSYTHASEYICGDGKWASAIKAACEGRSQYFKMRDIESWLPLKVPIKWDSLMTSTFMHKIAYKAQHAAEVKLGLRKISEMTMDMLIEDEAKTDALHEALFKTQVFEAIELIPVEKPPDDEWHTED
jgi:hypothetical protein